MINPTYKSELKQKIIEYEDAIKRNGDAPQGLLWSSAFTQELRFKQLIQDFDINNKSILDVGCGFGDIIPHLDKLSNTYKYIGVDMTPTMINIAEKNHPNHKFILRDYFENPFKQSFDIILSSGTLN